MTSWARTSSVLRAAAANGLPPVVAGVTTAEGTVFTEACGAAVGDIFWIASMTKAVTSVAALQPVEQGLVGLDDPLGLPQLADRQILEGFDAAGGITLRHLLSDTSGVADDVFSADIRRYREWAGMPETNGGRRAALDLRLVAEPGSAWQYGAGHDLAGLLIEKLTGTTIDRYFHQRIFAPCESRPGQPGADRSDVAGRSRLLARRRYRFSRTPSNCCPASGNAGASALGSISRMHPPTGGPAAWPGPASAIPISGSTRRRGSAACF